MTDDRQSYVRDLLEVCDLCFRSLDLLDKYWPIDDSDLVPSLLMTPMVIDGVLKELMRSELTATERSTVEAVKKRLRDRHDAIIRGQPDGFGESRLH
jgi:hypothetical protein